MLKKLDWPIILILVSTCGLMALGLLFCWKGPIGEWKLLGTHHFLKRQILFLIMGTLVGVGAYVVGWRRCVQAGPWLLAGWLVMCVVAPCWSFFPLAFALAMTWLYCKIGKRAVRLLVLLVYMGLLVFALGFVSNADRRESLRTFFTHLGDESTMMVSPLQDTQNRLAAAFTEADWFSGKMMNVSDIPHGMTDGAMSTAAQVFGRWFPMTVGMLLLLLATGFAFTWKRTADGGKRLFVLLAGGLVLVPTVNSFLVCLKMAPLHWSTVPVVSYGCAQAVGVLVLVGVLIAQRVDEWYNEDAVERMN